MIKWIITDLDGTLLSHDDNSGTAIDQNTLNVWNKFSKSNKVKMTIATGRHYVNVLDIMKQLGIEMPEDSYIIGMNGAQIYSLKEKKLIKNQVFADEDVKNFDGIINYLEESFPKGFFFMGYEDAEEILFYYDNKEAHVQPLIEEMTTYENKSGTMKHKVITNFDSLQRVYKAIILYTTDWDHVQESNNLKSRFSSFEFVKSSSRFLEILPKGVSKLEAIKQLNEQYKLQPKEIMVLGDSFNDYEMLKYTKNSVTRESSDPEIKKICTYVMDTEASIFVGDALDMLVELE
ncbi:MAG: Cof-type HAD-IIB family hydrolase [Mycoplasma sp.]